MRKIFATAMMFILLPAMSFAQDVASREFIQKTLDEIYNYHFKEAEVNIQRIREKLPNHPMTSILPAVSLYWKYFPMVPSKPAYPEYDAYLEKALRSAEQLMNHENTKTEGIFFALTVHCYRAMAQSDAGNNLAALKESKRALGFIKQGFKLKEQYPDFYLTTGMYNFYVEQYPEDHPIVKPFMWFFADGDKELGIKQLEMASQRGTFTKAEALYYLAYIHQRYRANTAKSLEFSNQLVRLYPQNPLYLSQHVHTLMASNRYQEAEPFVTQLLQRPEHQFLTSAHLYQGMIQEKFHKNLSQAKACYQKALELSPSDKSCPKEYYAMAYAGLGRIAAQEGNRDQARLYYKKSLNMSESKATEQEAKAYLKG